MIAIIDYRAGNLTSVKLAFETLGLTAEVTSSPRIILDADRVVFPGVGAAGAAMRSLEELGLIPVIREAAATKPFLGICLGTQIILESSEEDGGVSCIGLLPGRVKMFQPENRFDKVPQMGWNSVEQVVAHPLFEGIRDGSEFYFVHSYYPASDKPGNVAATTTYAGVAFASVLARRNLVATQFHPEKSGRVGLRLLENFVRWRGEEKPRRHQGRPC